MITAFEVTATFAGMFLGGGVGGVVGAMAGNAYKTLEYGQMTAAFLVDGLKDMAKHAVRAPLGSLAGGALTVSAPKGPMNPETWLKAHVAKINDELATASATVSYWIGAVKADDFTFDAGFDPATLTKSSLNIDGHSLFALPSFEDLDVKNGFLRGFLADFCDHLPKVRPAQAQEAERITQQPIRDRAAQMELTDIDGHLHWKYS